MKNTFLFCLLFVGFSRIFAQDNFNYEVLLEPLNVPGVQGLHSFVFAQHAGKWLIVGGRRDGILARQPLL